MKTHIFSLVLIAFSITTFGQVGINTENPQGIFNIDGGKNNVTTGTPTAVQLADDFIVTSSGATGIGASPNASAILDLTSSNKGFVAPRVVLTSITDSSTISSPATGLLVYNLGTNAGFTYVGYVFWNGSEWRSLDNSTAVSPLLGALVCASATLSPAGYTAGVSYTGNLRVPYTGGNGGSYQAGSSLVVNGLTFTLRSGKLEYGEGELVFSVSGTPTVTTDFTITFNSAEIPFLASGQSCTATITNQTTADIKNIAVVGNLTLTSDNGRIGYHLVATTPDGRWSVRCFLPTGTAFADVNLQLRYNGSASDPDTRDIIQNTTYMWGGGATTSGNQVRYPKNVWAGYNGNVSTLVTAVSQISTNFPNWGDPGVYASSIPEYRLYHWTDFDATGTKVFYTMEFMMGSSTPSGTASTTTCTSGTCTSTRVFFNLRQITAP